MPKGLTPDQAVAAINAFKGDVKVSMQKALEGAVRIVEPAARRNLQRQPVPGNQGVLEMRSGTEPGITVRYRSFPWAAGAEAGSKRYRQFRSYVGFGDQGYIVGQAIRDTEEKAARAAQQVLESSLKEELT